MERPSAHKKHTGDVYETDLGASTDSRTIDAESDVYTTTLPPPLDSSASPLPSPRLSSDASNSPHSAHRGATPRNTKTPRQKDEELDELAHVLERVYSPSDFLWPSPV